MKGEGTDAEQVLWATQLREFPPGFAGHCVQQMIGALRHRPSVGERSAIEVILRIADPGVVPTLADHPANIPSYFIVTLLSCPF